MRDEINALSLFDGMSCAQIALGQAGFKIKEYRASEIDKHAIKVTMANYPNTIQLGDVRNVNGYDLPRQDIVLAGSPCQGFSRAGKGLNFEDPRSILFFEFVRVLEECRKKNPEIKFFLENVMMDEECKNIISKILGVNPIMINSSLVSAQNRERLYWTNIGLEPNGLFGHLESVIKQPKDKGLILNDVLEAEVDEKYYLNERAIEKLLQWESRNKKNGNGFKINYANGSDKCPSLTTGPMKSNSTYVKRLFNIGNGGQGNKPYSPDHKSIALSALGGGRGAKTGLYAIVNDVNGLREIGDKSLNIDANYFKGHDNHGARTMIVCHNSQPRTGDPSKGGTGHLSRTDGKTYALDTKQSNRIEHDFRIRRLIPLECERLQTVKDNYTNHVSDSQRYKMLGNGWTVDVISHILSYWK